MTAHGSLGSEPIKADLRPNQARNRSPTVRGVRDTVNMHCELGLPVRREGGNCTYSALHSSPMRLPMLHRRRSHVYCTEYE